MAEIDVTNQFMVSAGASGVGMLMPPKPGRALTPDEALVLAAWLVALAEPSASHSFEDVLAAVRAT